MIEILVFTAAGIGLYILSDAILRTLERIHGDTLPYRNLIFFFTILALAVPLFKLLQIMFRDG